MESLHSKIDLEAYRKQTQNAFKTRRDELVGAFVKGINLERLGGSFPQILPKEVALRLAMNPALKRHDQDGEVELLLKECQTAGTYKKFFWACPMNKKLSPPNPQKRYFSKKRDMNV